MADETDRDPTSPTPEELRETAASEGLMAGEEETDPTYVERDGGVDLEEEDGTRPYDPSPEDEAPPAS